MEFYSVRDLRTDSKSMWRTLASGREVVLTNNGKPAALMIDVSNSDFEQVLMAIRQAKAMIAYNSMRAVAAENGYMSEEEIEAEISAARRGE